MIMKNEIKLFGITNKAVYIKKGEEMVRIEILNSSYDNTERETFIDLETLFKKVNRYDNLY